MFLPSRMMQESEIDRLFKLYFLRMYSKQLTNVFIVAIPFYIILKVRGIWETKNFVIIGILLVASLACLYVTNRITKKLKGN